MEQYLVTYREDCGRGRETVGAMMYPYEIARLYGFSDCSGVDNIRAFRIADDGAPVEVKLGTIPGRTVIQLIKRENGEVLDTWDWPEH